VIDVVLQMRKGGSRPPFSFSPVFVIAAFVAALDVFAAPCLQDVDARNKSGHDGKG
jgi:hypothetical protein